MGEGKRWWGKKKASVWEGCQANPEVMNEPIIKCLCSDTLPVSLNQNTALSRQMSETSKKPTRSTKAWLWLPTTATPTRLNQQRCLWRRRSQRTPQRGWRGGNEDTVWVTRLSTSEKFRCSSVSFYRRGFRPAWDSRQPCNTEPWFIMCACSHCWLCNITPQRRRTLDCDFASTGALTVVYINPLVVLC